MKMKLVGLMALVMAILLAGCNTPRGQVADYQEVISGEFSSVGQCFQEATKRHDLILARWERSEAERWIDGDFLSDPEREQVIAFQREREGCQQEFRSGVAAGGYSSTYPFNAEAWWSEMNETTALLLAGDITWGLYFQQRSKTDEAQQMQYEVALRNAWNDAIEKEQAASEAMSKAIQDMGATSGGATVQCKEAHAHPPVQVHTFRGTQCPAGYIPL